MKYEHIISLGHFCGVASELEKLGYREASLPFDWLITPFDSLMIMINTHFNGFLNIDNLVRDEKKPYIVLDKKYNIAFYHDFSMRKSIKEQVDTVRKKYERRIERFYKYITETTLFIRYIETKQEYDYLSENYNYVIGVLREYNKDNNLILISKDIKQDKLFLYTVYKSGIPKRHNPQKFVKENAELLNKLKTLPYCEEKKRLNLKRYRKSLPKKMFNKIKKFFKRVLYR